MDATSFSSSSDECFMPEEILTEILCRLPVKSIFKFKSVCRGWFSLLSSPSFMDFYKTRMYQWTLVGKYLYDEPNYYIPPNYNLSSNLYSLGSENYKSNKPPSFSMVPARWSLVFPEDENQKKTVCVLEILGSSNGWLLCMTIPQWFEEPPLRVINPLTMQCVAIPNSYFYGICYGFVTKAEGDLITSYRVVILVWPTDDYGLFEFSATHLEFAVFCSETREWKVSRVRVNPHPVELSPCFDKVAFTLQNVLHWFNGATILAYHLDYGGGSGDQCRFISLPADRTMWTNNHLEGREELWDMPSDNMCGVAQDGCITYVEMVGLGKGGFEEGGLRVWKLRDYQKGEWNLEHKVKNRDIIFDPRLREPLTHVLAFHPLDSEIVYLERSCAAVDSFDLSLPLLDLEANLAQSREFIVSYNVRLRKLEVIQSPVYENEGRVFWCWSHTLPFVLQWPTRLPISSTIAQNN